MWTIDKNSLAIDMHRGDTGGRYLQFRKKSGTDFNEGDVVIFEVKRGNTVKMHRVFPLDDDEGAGNGRFLLAFRNADTDTWDSGSYRTEFRVVLNPVYVSSAVRDGDTVRTPIQSTLNIRDVIIEI